MSWSLIPEIKDFVKGLEKGTIRKNNRSTHAVCFLPQVKNKTPLLLSAAVVVKSF